MERSTPKNKSDQAVPDYVGIEVTRRCNLKCPHCFTDSGGVVHPGAPTESLGAMLAELARIGVTTVAFSGGEPLLRRDLEQVMAAGREAGIQRYTLVTNGFYAERDRVRSLKAAGLEAVQVSVDGVDAIGHTAVRHCSPVDYYRALRAIRLYQDAGIVVDVATIICPENVARAAEMLLLCEALSVRSLRYCSFVPTGRAADDEIAVRFAVEPEQLDVFLDFTRTVHAQPDAPVGVVFDHGIGPWVETGKFVCDSGSSVAYISAEGDVYPCPGTIFEPFRVGNVFQESPEAILTSPGMARARSIQRSELGAPCRDCLHTQCSGGCRGAAFATGGDMFGPPAYCNLIRRR